MAIISKTCLTRVLCALTLDPPLYYANAKSKLHSIVNDSGNSCERYSFVKTHFMVKDAIGRKNFKSCSLIHFSTG